LIGGAFAVGWGSRALAQPSAPAPPPVAAHAAEPTASGCIDPAAMAANANLVVEVRAAERRAAAASGQASEAEGRAAAARADATRRFATSRDEWSRMAREGTIRVKIPCASWNSRGHLEVQRVSGSRTIGMSSRGWPTVYAESAGFSREELDTLGEVYERVQERTWEAMRPTCESDPAYREALVSSEGEATARAKIDACRGSFLDLSTYGVPAGLAAGVELRAAGDSRERATGATERLFFALSEAPAFLDEEMTRAFGREKALSAVDNGVACFDEVVYDLRTSRDTPNN
jgi:hypothetical protein